MQRSIPAGNFFFVPEDREQEREDLRAVLRLPAGRRTFRRLLAAGNVMGVSFGRDERGTEYNEGIRAVGLWLATKLEAAAPGELARLMQDSGEDRQAANAAGAKADGRRGREEIP